MKIIINIIVLFLLLICSASNASQPSESLNETLNADIIRKYGTSSSPIFIQRKETEEEKKTKVDEVTDRKKNLEIQAELQKIAEENLEAVKEANNAAYLAIFVGIAIAIIAIGQLFMFLWQLRLLRKANKSAEMAAEAALVQANTVMGAERAYVKISHLKPGLKKINDNVSVVEVEVKNFGRTPAHVTDAIIDLKYLDYGEQLPSPFPFRLTERESFPNGFLMPNEGIQVSRHVNNKQLNVTGKQLWVFGYVDYIDVYSRRWRGGYARKYIDQIEDNLVYNTEARDNFDRERTPDEGMDWDEESIALYNERKKKCLCLIGINHIINYPNQKIQPTQKAGRLIKLL